MSFPVIPRLLAGLAVGLLPALLLADPPKPATPAPTEKAKPADSSPAVDPVDVDKKIIAEVKDRTQVMKNLQHLCDVIGPRVTGSPGLEKANKWAEKKMTEYGLTNVKLEPWEIPLGWERGACTLTLTEPTKKTLTAASAAWAPGTKGKVSGEVVVVDGKTKEDLAKYKGKLKGAVVLTSPPATVKPLSEIHTYLQPGPRPMRGGQSFDELRAYQKALSEFLVAEGVVATLRDSAKPHGLLVMTGSWPDETRAPTSQLTRLFITHEHYTMLHRLATDKDGPTPKVELEVSNKFTPGPLTVYNTVGEVTGSEKPDEFVVVGAHLDSWDLGSGATDNGTGSCVVLEVARVFAALAKAGVRPKRTVRFALFTGEEQGLHGSKQYVKKHKDEMAKTSACLVHDTGTGKVKGFGLQNRESVKAVLDPQLETLKTVDGWTGLVLRGIGGTDHLSFDAKEVNVPGFACEQDPDEYYLTHHTQSDTFDHVKEPNLVQGAQVIAVTAMRIANLPDLLPRDRKEEAKPAEPKKDDKPAEPKKEEKK